MRVPRADRSGAIPIVAGECRRLRGEFRVRELAEVERVHGIADDESGRIQATKHKDLVVGSRIPVAAKMNAKIW